MSDYNSNKTLMIIECMAKLFMSCNIRDKQDCVNYFKENLNRPVNNVSPDFVYDQIKNLPTIRAIIFIYDFLMYNDRNIILAQCLR